MKKAARNLAQSCLTSDLLAELFWEAFLGESPQIGELGFIDHLSGHDDHRRLQLIESRHDCLSIRQARLSTQIGSRHFPFPSQYLQQRQSRRTQMFFLLAPPHAPDCIEIWDHPWRQKHGLSALQFTVVNTAPAKHLIFKHPCL